jgi:hypothetical protein
VEPPPLHLHLPPSEVEPHPLVPAPYPQLHLLPTGKGQGRSHLRQRTPLPKLPVPVDPHHELLPQGQHLPKHLPVVKPPVRHIHQPPAHAPQSLPGRLNGSLHLLGQAGKPPLPVGHQVGVPQGQPPRGVQPQGGEELVPGPPILPHPGYPLQGPGIGLGHRAQVQEDQNLLTLQGSRALLIDPVKEGFCLHPWVGQEAVKGFGLVEAVLEGRRERGHHLAHPG